LAFGPDLDVADSRLELQQLQLLVGEFFAAAPYLAMRTLELVLGLIQLLLELFDEFGLEEPARMGS